MEQDDEQVIERPPWRHERNRFTRAARRALIGITLVGLGVAAGVWAERRVFGGSAQSAGTGVARVPAGAPSTAAQSAASSAPPDASADVEVVLTPEGLARAELKTATVGTVEAVASVRVPGGVTPNAYREVKVTPIAGGIVTEVHVALGDAVRRGAPVVTLFSAELAEAQTKYLSMAAMLEADHKKLDRTQQLVAIGAASRQELEEVTAVHEGHTTEVESARQRLLLLGLKSEQVQALRSASHVVSTVVVPAPIDGVITGRSVNLGQVVSMGQELLIVTYLSEVWVIGDVYEQDFQAVGMGSEAVITATAYPGLTLRGRVTYLDPRVDVQTRTAKVRVEVPNPGGRLRLGMYVSMVFTTRAAERVVVVPRAAVQSIGERSVVYLPVKDEEGKFVQRQVRLGQLTGDAYTVPGPARSSLLRGASSCGPTACGTRQANPCRHQQEARRATVAHEHLAQDNLHACEPRRRSPVTMPSSCSHPRSTSGRLGTPPCSLPR
jgi:RND family efflux transporter MFP subunit